MRAQAGHLRELSGRRGVEVRILPYSAGSHPAIYGGFTIFDFPSAADLPMVVHTEGYTGGSYFEGEEDVREMDRRWTRVLDLSISIKEFVHR